MKDITDKTYQTLVEGIGSLLAQGRSAALKKVNTILVETYWHVGQQIVEFEQAGQIQAEYGKELLLRLSKDLKTRYGKGFSRSNLQYMRLLYTAYPKRQTLSGKLSWSHYVELLSISDDAGRSFYEKQCIAENWSVRELKRQRNASLFERIALSRDRNEVAALSSQGQVIETSKDIIKDPYVFEFLGIPEKGVWSERSLENALIDKLGHFLLELGKGFAFIGQQYRMTLDNTHYYVDLVFYHRILKCFVLIDLKTRKVNHQDVGQMNLYLNYFKKEENMADDKPPIGIILSADKDEILVEYATGSISNQLFVSQYQLYLPDKKLLEEKLRLFMGEQALDDGGEG